METSGHRTAGWNPTETTTEDGRSIKLMTGEHGGYGPPYEGQIITRQDALELAAALERALVDIPDVPEARELTKKPVIHLRDWILLSSSILERSAASKEILKDFIWHCRDCSEFWLC
jgi:hypothetical protein